LRVKKEFSYIGDFNFALVTYYIVGIFDKKCKVFKNVGRREKSTCWLLIWVAYKYLSLQDPKIIFPLVMFVNCKDVRVFLLID
jgi:hypothetical protein